MYKNKHGKIELPWANEPTRDIKWENTHAYWLMAQDWNGTSPNTKGATVADSLSDCNEILASHSTQKSMLQGVVSNLRDDIIHYGTKKSKERMLKKKGVALQDNKQAKSKIVLM